MNGLKLADFKNQEEALNVANVLIEENKKEFEHDGGCQEVPGYPLLNKYFFVQGLGKKRTWSQSENKELEGEADVKNRKLLHEAGAFTEALGDQSPQALCDVKEEVPGKERLVKSIEAVKTLLLI